jgi:hypothetical protein
MSAMGAYDERDSPATPHIPSENGLALKEGIRERSTNQLIG